MGNVEANMGTMPPMGLMMWPEFNELVAEHNMNKYDRNISTFVEIVYQMADNQTRRPSRGVQFVHTFDKTERDTIWTFLDEAYNLYVTR